MLVPLLLLILLVVTTAWAYVRGTSADAEVRNPTSSAEPPISQLRRLDDGHITVRAAGVLPYPRQKVWAVVTDFAHYSDFLPYVKDVTVEPAQDGTKKLVKGKAKSAFYGYWDFQLHANEEKEKADEWRVWWREKGEGEVLVNNGTWALREAGTGETLLVLELETEVRSTPNWLLRNFYLYRLRQVIAAVRARLDADAAAASAKE
jgi:ribosome-associated toxin RatA of RatAB toxin-antitoxin module